MPGNVATSAGGSTYFISSNVMMPMMGLASVPEVAFVVALGDSQTYGTGVRREENWPHRLQETIGRPVYGISCGGWGPVQGFLLMDQALALRGGLDPNDLKLITAVFVFVALILPGFLRRMQKRAPAVSS